MGGPGQEGNVEVGVDELRMNRMVLPEKAGLRLCPFEGCSGRAAIQKVIQVHFWHRHVRDAVVILEEGNLFHPWFPLCDILVPWRPLKESHKRTAQCKKGEERN